MRSFDFSIYLILPAALCMVLESMQPLTQMSTKNIPGGKARPARKADCLGSVGSSTSLNPVGLHGLMRGQLLHDFVESYFCAASIMPWRREAEGRCRRCWVGPRAESRRGGDVPVLAVTSTPVAQPAEQTADLSLIETVVIHSQRAYWLQCGEFNARLR
jgi:hypothetical protein